MTVFLVLLAVVLTGWWLLKTWRTPPLGLLPDTSSGAAVHDDDLDLPPQFRLQSGYDALFSSQDALTIQTRHHFFVPSESNLYAELVAALAGRAYRVFPNVRLDYVFQLTANTSPETMCRLRAQVVSFLIVETPEFRPVLGVSLSGSSHGLSHCPDAPDDDNLLELAFRSARLPLLNIDAKRNIEAEELQKLVMPHLLRA